MKRRIVKTEAVVLKRMDYLDTSRIVTLFTRDEGKVSVLAKGARARTNRFGSALEPGAIVQVVYYWRANRELQTLTQADILVRHRHHTSSMDRLAGVLHILDLGHAVTDPGNSHPELFDLFSETLQAIDTPGSGLPALLLWFRLRLAELSGVTPGFSVCVQCGKDVVPVRNDEGAVFDVSKGGVVCSSCGGGRRAAPAGSSMKVTVQWPRLKTLHALAAAAPAGAREMELSGREWNELDAIMRLYERNHLLHGRVLKTESMVKEFIV